MARDRRDSMRELFRSYREAVDAIIMLRAFRRQEIPIRYQLIEIPTTLFTSVEDAPLEVYQRDAPAIECKVDGQTVAVIATDRSDAKITVRNIRLSACTVHAEWTRREPLIPVRGQTDAPESLGDPMTLTDAATRRRFHLDSLEDIVTRVGAFEITVARLANDPAMDVGQVPQMLVRARNQLGEVRETLRNTQCEVVNA